MLVSGAQSPTSPGATPSGAAARIDPLDWTKGALVVCMVVYHAVNYSAFRPLAFRYMPFLPPSFVLIAGFVVGAVYTARYDLRTWSPYARLLVRGGKLFLLFALLNLGSCIALERSLVDGSFEFVDRSAMIFLSGNGREGIFEVLLPIAYFLLLVPALLWLRTRAAAAIPICALAIFGLCFVMERFGWSSKNLMMLSAGILGLALGSIPLEAVNRFAGKWLWVLLVYLLYLLGSWFLGDTYPVQMFSAVASVLLLYACALRLDMSAWAGRQLVLFGQYSLLAYLAQIALIRAIVPLVGGKPQHWAGVIVVGTSTAIILFCLIHLVNSLRRRNRPMNILYQSIFA